MANENVTLSVSIVSYNGFDDVSKAVESIEKFTPAALTKVIYVVDNADERAKYEPFAARYDDVVYLYTGKNLGFGAGHNYVLDRLKSRYHAIVNPDVLLSEDSFTKILDYMQREDVGVCAPKLVDESGALQRVYRREITVFDLFVRTFAKGVFKKRYDWHTMGDMDYTKPFQVPFAQGSFLVFRTALLKELNGFDDRYFMYMEDADLCRRANQVSRVMYFPGTSVMHKWERGSHKNKVLRQYHIDSMKKYMKKWGPKLW